MEKLLKGEVNPALVGLAQSLAVTIYCAAVGGFIFFVGENDFQPGFIGVFLMLVLLVFSAAITGLLVFGLPAYLALKNKMVEAIAILGYSLLFFFIIILIIIIALFSTVLS